ncbi:major facilitator superfamily domain-containing protein 8-like isoform X2 [Dysidea avara]|uniref:major facilitator superfamily domain-containing protein 8-like isoform X2 n=1 Tax=Dysidea avara TaxID=196820 RepID=UPI0033210108
MMARVDTKSFDDAVTNDKLGNPRASIQYNENLSQSTSQSSGQYGAFAITGNVDTDVSETRRQRFHRYLSLGIIMFNMLISSTGFSLTYGSVWPYYEKIDDSASESFLGLIIAAFSMGQLIFSPLLGIWSNYRPLTEPLIISFIIYIFGNLLYIFAEAFKDIDKWILLASKFTVGAGAAHVAIMRSYCSAASLEDERNTVMSFLSALQILGYSIGPGMMYEPNLGEDGYEWQAAKLHLNLYTGPSFLGIFLLIVSIVLTTCFFKEFDVHKTKTMIPLREIIFGCYYCCQSNCQKSDDKKPREKEAEKRYDRIGAIVCIFLYFLILSMFALQEAILSPLAQDEYAWNNKEASLYVNVMFAIISFITAVVLVGTKYLIKCVSERIVLIGTLLTMIVGLVIWMPYGPGHPDVEILVLKNSTNHHPVVAHGSDHGCDFLKQSWCLHLPKIHLSQLIIGLVVVAVGRGASNLLCYTIYSKLLGPWPQGLMMGFLSASASFGRIVGPSLLAKVYHEEGPRVTFLICIGVVLIGVITTIAFYTRLVPYSVYEQKKMNGYLPIDSDHENYDRNINAGLHKQISENSS